VQDIAIRSAYLADAAEIVLIQRAAIDTIDDSIYGPRERGAWRDRPAEDLLGLIRAGRYRVAVHDRLVVGGAGWEEAGDGIGATIRAVHVHPAAHGRGIGALLISGIEAELAARGLTRIVVPAALNAVGFYQRLGYRPVERRLAQLGGVALPYQQMLKEAA
jgi:GNAT superfamily N-acetyltransferase